MVKARPDTIWLDLSVMQIKAWMSAMSAPAAMPATVASSSDPVAWTVM